MVVRVIVSLKSEASLSFQSKIKSVGASSESYSSTQMKYAEQSKSLPDFYSRCEKTHKKM